MLKHRIITAIILIPIVLFAVFRLTSGWFALVLGTVTCLGAWEWAAMSGYGTALQRILYTSLLALVALAGFYFREALSTIYIYTALIWWALATVLILTYGKRPLPTVQRAVLKGVMGVFILVPAWLSLFLLHSTQPDGVVLVLFLLILIWIADSAAYFSGKHWGKTKLCPHISPGKTWEGVLGALSGSVIFAIFYAITTQMQIIEIMIFLVICSLTVIISVFGDLMVSMIKREAKMKDSGRLLPGHGGVMDRIDSLTAAGPIFLAGQWTLESVR